MNNKFTRRKFLKTAAISGVTTAVVSNQVLNPSAAKDSSNFQPFPTRKLGKTGVEIPLISIGCGSRFLAIKDEEKALELLEYGLDNGLYYWDTAANYQKDGIYSEERLGKLLKQRRKDVFLGTKVAEREGDEAKKTIERSLKRLQTDYIDLLQIHSIKSLEDVENIGKKGNVLEVLYKYKEEGIVKHIGFSGHTSAAAMKKAAEMYDFDMMLIPMNHYNTKQKFEEQAVPAAAEKGMGILVMKVIRPRENIDNLNPQDLISYALSLDNITSTVIGIDSLEILKENIEFANNFNPLSSSRMEEIRAQLRPFYNHENLDWMNPKYVDGMNFA